MMTKAEILASNFWEKPHKTQFVDLEMWECLQGVSPRLGDYWPNEHEVTAVTGEGDTLIMSFIVFYCNDIQPYERTITPNARMTITIKNPDQIAFHEKGFEIGVASRIRWEIFDYNDPSPENMRYIEYTRVAPTKFVRRTNGDLKGAQGLNPPIFMMLWKEMIGHKLELKPLTLPDPLTAPNRRPRRDAGRSDRCGTR
jgi:hypothetical protein